MCGAFHISGPVVRRREKVGERKLARKSGRSGGVEEASALAVTV